MFCVVSGITSRQHYKENGVVVFADPSSGRERGDEEKWAEAYKPYAEHHDDDGNKVIWSKVNRR